VLTTQLQQAIRLLQMSNIELSSVADKEVTENPFLQRADREAGPPATGGAAMAQPNGGLDGISASMGGEAPAPPFRPADCSLALKRAAGRAFDDERTPFEARLTRPKGLREHLGEQVLALLRSPGLQGAALQIVESVAVAGYHRKHAIRVLGARASNGVAERRRSRPRYDEAIREAVVALWEASDRVCGKPLIPVLRQARTDAELELVKARVLDRDGPARRCAPPLRGAALPRILATVAPVTGPIACRLVSGPPPTSTP
jgi:hypothetical protein